MSQRSGRAHTRKKPKSNPQGRIEIMPDGYGFVSTAEGSFFVPAKKAGGAFDGDIVEIAPIHFAQSGSDKRPTARVLNVLSRAHESVIGRYEVAAPFGVVVPLDPRITHDIFTMRADYPNIADGSIVRVRMLTFPSRNEAATGAIEEVLGDALGESLPVDLIIARHKLETCFSDASLQEACSLRLDVDGALQAGYRDLRDRRIFTIDPADARDFDDAISLEEVERGGETLWQVGVHIADVSQYVAWESSIDLDARRRATSVYLVDRVIPMLPEELSNDLCSLRPNEDRLTMTIDMVVDATGKVRETSFYPAVIRSQARLTYEGAQSLLDGEEAPYGALRETLRTLSRIADARAAARKRAGGLDFESTEAKAVLDDEGVPVRIDLRRKTPATSLVEECMIMANEEVAKVLESHAHPSVYRVHEQPLPESLSALVPAFEEFPWFAKIDKDLFCAGDSHMVARALDESAGRPEGELVSSLILRAMKRAVYRTDCAGHYGLASSQYTHFTSPIRRYPDLIVHRMLKDYLGFPVAGISKQIENLSWLAEHSSEMERIADTAARQSQEYKIVEYMAAFIGQRFTATIAETMTYGLYVRLENTAQGLLPVRELGSEYFALDPLKHILTGQDTGERYRIGQTLDVVLKEAVPETRSLVFGLYRA